MKITLTNPPSKHISPPENVFTKYFTKYNSVNLLSRLYSILYLGKFHWIGRVNIISTNWYQFEYNGHVIKSERLLNIPLKIIEKSKRLQDHQFFCRLWICLWSRIFLKIITCEGFLHFTVIIEVCVIFPCCININYWSTIFFHVSVYTIKRLLLNRHRVLFRTHSNV